MKFEAAMFDLDGTLLDTLEDLADSMNSVLESHGLPVHDLSAYKYFVGAGMLNLVRQALPENLRDDAVIEKQLEEMKEAYNARMMAKTKPYAGIPDLLNNMTERGLRMVILSNKPDPFTCQMVEKLLGDWQFELVAGSREGVPRKPDPTAALAMAETMGIKPEKFIYLGDTGIDMKTASAAGMFPVGVLWGFRTAEELQENGAAKLVAHPLEVLELL